MGCIVIVCLEFVLGVHDAVRISKYIALVTQEQTIRREARRAARKATREEIFNIPNMLTILRIILIIPVIGFMLQQDAISSFLAAVLISIAALTDGLDGLIARQMGLISVLGKFLDPLADKLLVMAVLVIAAQLGRIPGWFVVLLLSRELAITGLRSIASSEGLVIEVVEAGKLKTALQLVGLIGVAVHYAYVINFGLVSVVVNFNVLGFALLAMSMVFSLASAMLYFGRFMGAIGSSRSAPS